MNGKIDKFGQVINCYQSAMAIREAIIIKRACAIALSLGNMTMFHMSFVNLAEAVPRGNFVYQDGSARGLQVNIDRFGSYATPWDNPIGHMANMSEKLHITLADGEALQPFINTILTGENHFVDK